MSARVLWAALTLAAAVVMTVALGRWLPATLIAHVSPLIVAGLGAALLAFAPRAEGPVASAAANEATAAPPKLPAEAFPAAEASASWSAGAGTLPASADLSDLVPSS